jgi:hypothetical protein
MLTGLRRRLLPRRPASTPNRDTRPVQRFLGLVIGLTALSLAIALPAQAQANVFVFGQNYLDYGSCCNGATLDGTRAYVSVSSDSPQSTGCVLFDSVVSSNDSNRQLEVGIARCGSSTSLDGMCSLTNNLVKYVERIPASGSAVCYPHGAASYNSSDLFTVDDSANNGNWYAYIDGTLEQGQSGYDSQVRISEWGEDSQHDNYSCSGWGGAASFSSWQRYNYGSNQWTTVQSSSQRNVNNCWNLGLVSNGSFSVSH